jgi:tRNA G46 methylase TrmB
MVAPAKYKSAFETWDRMLNLQIDFGLPVELPIFYAFCGWIECSNVLDIGTGNGRYVEELLKRFPDKKFVCIEPELDYVKFARNRFGKLSQELSK